MRHLSTSLPNTSRSRTDPSADLLPDFKQAALSVTNLYKAAHTAQQRARSAGYQDALDDLLAFLDRENLGLMDGEGWRVRQWATQNLDGDAATAPAMSGSSAPRSTVDDDGEDRSSAGKEDYKDEDASSSPEIPRKAAPADASMPHDLYLDDDGLSRRRVVSEPPPAQSPTTSHVPPQGDFTFQSHHAYPSNHDREDISALSGSMDLDSTSTGSSQGPIFLPSSAPSSAEAVRILPRSNRGNRPGTHHNRRTNDSRIPTFNFNLGAGAGSKRKLPYSDFFDITGFNDAADRKDGGNNNNGGGSNNPGRGGKRGRHV